jgi:aldose 1-epimerase
VLPQLTIFAKIEIIWFPKSIVIDMELERLDWGVINNKKVDLIKVKDLETDFEVQITNIGASIVRVRMPDKNNNIEDICFGRDTAQEYYENTDGAYFGATVGRYAATLPWAKFVLDNKINKLTPNMLGVHHQHGGNVGLGKKIWAIDDIKEDSNHIAIKMSCMSQDGEEGYSGNLKTEIIFDIKPMYLSFTLKSSTDKKTIINLTNHSYWNLDGLDSLIDNLNLKIYSDCYTMLKAKRMIIGTLVRLLRLTNKIGKNPYYLNGLNDFNLNFKEFNSLKSIFKEFGNLDYTFLIDGYNDKYEKNIKKDILLAAEMHSPKKGRYMKIKTTEPSVLLYSGNSMKGAISFGKECEKHNAICFETMKPLNSIQFSEFKDMVILSPEEEYYHKTEFEFDIIV